MSPRFMLSGDSLVANWQWLARASGRATCAAAIKANGYGLGARDVLHRLRNAGCRDFYVASWAEAAALADQLDGISVSVLHGVRAADLNLAAMINARPVLCTPGQVALWRDEGAGRPCDVMIDTGINRLGLMPDEVSDGLLDGLVIDTLMSHLASADQDVKQNEVQRVRFREIAGAIKARRYSLANSAGICLGEAFQFDLTRPGLAIYGGIPRAEAASHIRQVVFPQAQVLRVATIAAGQSVGYNATWTTERTARIATIQIGYADGYLRGFSNRGSASWQGRRLAVVGRVSMDLVTLAVPDYCHLSEGDWVDIDYSLPEAATASELSQYELLTGLGQRAARIWR